MESDSVTGSGSRDGRFAPSPTGDLHLGNLRTALLAWLFARSSGSSFRVRMEDLDSSRVRPGVEERQLRDIAALGLDRDGPVVRQSERGHLYEDALAKLDDRGLLYPCYCTRREIAAEIRAASSAPHASDMLLDSYPGTCRDLTRRQRAGREASGRSPALRLRSDVAETSFVDGLLGEVSGPVDDFVVRRNDGSVSYQLAVVVDDAEQGIGEVVRGSDLAGTTPRQVYLSGKLGLPSPLYAHVPLVVGADGQRLAKRHGATTMSERMELGDSPPDILAWMARSVGLAEVGEMPTLGDILGRFDPTVLPVGDTVWDGGESRLGD